MSRVAEGVCVRTERDDDTVKGLVHQHWDGRAETFDEAPEHGIHSEAQREAWLSVLREWTGAGPRRVLDVGCGTGVLSLLLAALEHDVTGVDFAPRMLARARSKTARSDHEIDFVRGDAETLPVQTDTVDLVTARHLVWTLPNPRHALAEWRRVVRPDDHVLLLEGYWDHDEPWDEYEAIHEDLPLYDGRPPAALADVLASAGFEGIVHEPLMGPVLRGEEPRHQYYVMRATVPG